MNQTMRYAKKLRTPVTIAPVSLPVAIAITTMARITTGTSRIRTSIR
jgi:hypothetical protein